MSFAHQDWKPVVFRKKIDNKKSSKNTKVVARSNVKNHTGLNKNTTVKDDDEIKKIKTVGLETGKQIQQARLAKKIKQKELAQRLNVQVSIIQQYENGKAKYNGAMLTRIGKVLGVRLTGKKRKKSDKEKN